MSHNEKFKQNKVQLLFGSKQRQGSSTKVERTIFVSGVTSRVSNMVRKSPSPRELSPKLSGSFHPSCDFATFGLAGRAPEAFLATWYFSGLFWQTRRPEMPLQCNFVAKRYHSGSNNSRQCLYKQGIYGSFAHNSFRCAHDGQQLAGQSCFTPTSRHLICNTALV